MNRLLAHITPMHTLLAAVLAACMVACTIEPPLHIAETREIEMDMPEIVTDIDVIWDADIDWRSGWWYGWDDEDISRWGTIDYPDPESFEVRYYYLGNKPGQPHIDFQATSISQKRIHRRFSFGYHNMLFWSDIVTPTGTQVVNIDESDVTNIIATSSPSRLSYVIPHAPKVLVCNSPEIFYSVHERDFYVSADTADYDYYDADRRIWVRHFNTTLRPMVYTYLVQYVIYNNKGRITGIADYSTISSLADGVSLHTGITSDHEVAVSFDMRMKKALTARDGKQADIIGGKLTTFGMCGMQPWKRSRSARYEGSRDDLANHLTLNLAFSNSTDSIYNYDITPQMRAHAHGGVITIEIDADTLTLPRPKEPGSAGAFDPWVVPQDSVTNEFIL